MPPTSRDSVAAKPRPLSALSRTELGDLWAAALRVARAEGRFRTSGGTLKWLSAPDVQLVMDEFFQRHLERELEYDFWLAAAEDWPPS